MKITIFGSGSWGTAVAILLDGNGNDVTIWSAFKEEAEALRSTRVNPRLPGVRIPASVTVTADLSEAAADTEFAVIAVPSFAVRETVRKARTVLSPDCMVLCISKGIEQETAMRFSQVLAEELGRTSGIVILSGPSHAEEVSRRIPTACVAASEDLLAAQRVQDLFMNDTFRVYTSTDVLGVELGAAFKNVIALAAGICDGLGYGDNTIAMLATRGLAEIAELCVAMGGRKDTLAGLAGLGDLIVTCTSRHSRNRRAGVLIGQGLTAEDAMRRVGAVVEGYYAAQAAVMLSGAAGVEMPICRETYEVLYHHADPRESLYRLMTRTKRAEDAPSNGGANWVL